MGRPGEGRVEKAPHFYLQSLGAGDTIKQYWREEGDDSSLPDDLYISLGTQNPKKQPQEKYFERLASASSACCTPCSGALELVLGTSRLPVLCLYHLAGTGLLMTNLCPRGTEPRERCCCGAGRPPVVIQSFCRPPSCSSLHRLLDPPQCKHGF